MCRSAMQREQGTAGRKCNRKDELDAQGALLGTAAVGIPSGGFADRPPILAVRAKMRRRAAAVVCFRVFFDFSLGVAMREMMR